jgi:hypothetical protein
MLRMMFRAIGVLVALACVAGLLALAAESAAFAQSRSDGVFADAD